MRADLIHDLDYTDPLVLSRAPGLRSFEAVAAPAGTPLGTVLSNAGGVWTVYDGSHPAAAVLEHIAPTPQPNHVYPKFPWLSPPPAGVNAIVVVRDAELRRSAIVGLDSAAASDLAALGLILRDVQ